MDKAKISVVIPVFKVEQYLRNCIESVINQSYTNWELIMVDDGSPDRCGEICDEYAAKDSRIKVIHKENGGQSSARNAGLDLPPKGEFVTFLDSDDFWYPEYLETLMNLQQKYHADIVQCCHLSGMETKFPCLEEVGNISVLSNHEIFIREYANIVMWGKLYRTNLFDGIRMPVGLYNEDDWTMWKLYYRCKTIVVTSRHLYYYTDNPNSTMARLTKKPDLRYVNAYKERIDFFVHSGEIDLEHCSRLQLCKSLLLNYHHDKLSEKERSEIKGLFNDSWKVLRHSPYIKSLYKILFAVFSILPLMTSKLVTKFR